MKEEEEKKTRKKKKNTKIWARKSVMYDEARDELIGKLNWIKRVLVVRETGEVQTNIPTINSLFIHEPFCLWGGRVWLPWLRETFSLKNTLDLDLSPVLQFFRSRLR